MNWEALGAIGEIVGAVAVVSTLLYLARQTTINTNTVVAASTRASSWGFAEFNERLASSPELAALLQKSFQPAMPEFTDLEWLRFQLLARSAIGRFQDTYLQSRMSTQDGDLAETQLDYLRGMLELPAWRKYWDDESDTWVRDFVQNVESREKVHIGLSTLDEIHTKSKDISSQ